MGFGSLGPEITNYKTGMGLDGNFGLKDCEEGFGLGNRMLQAPYKTLHFDWHWERVFWWVN